jgi:hypothetical protein
MGAVLQGCHHHTLNAIGFPGRSGSHSPLYVHLKAPVPCHCLACGLHCGQLSSASPFAIPDKGKPRALGLKEKEKVCLASLNA